jgi:hypothetical protein
MDKKDILVTTFNQLHITSDIKPIKVQISYVNGEGDVMVEFNYVHEKIFSEDSEYTNHNKNLSQWGKGISVYLEHQIFTALSQYKFEVARNGYSLEKELSEFESTIKLKKTNGDWIKFYARNYVNSQGFYPYNFYNNAHIQVGGKVYDIETSDTESLDDKKFFFVGKTTGLDGNKTSAYFFCKFFEIKTE